MKRKSLIVAKKVENRNKSIKDLKIKKIYSNFRTVINKKVKKKDFAIAVSGGADSLCLAYFSKIYASEFKNRIYVLIVDHGLRKESNREAVKVKKILKNKNISSSILKWNGKAPDKNIQSNARNMRYSLIHEFCLKKKIRHLVTAHHMDDQIENFFIRLFRGSGITGLSSMEEISKYNNNLKIIRPFLSNKKNDLKYATIKYFKTYINDPSNNDEKFLRIKIRKYRKDMEKYGLNSDKIINTVNNLMSANKALNFYKKKALYKYVSFLSKKECIIDEKIFFQESGEIIFKCFSDILSLISGTYYPPRSKKILSLIIRLKSNNFTKSTLGGCVIDKKNKLISVSKESKFSKV